MKGGVFKNSSHPRHRRPIKRVYEIKRVGKTLDTLSLRGHNRVVEVVQTAQYEEWFENLKDDRAKARIATRIERIKFHGRLLGDAKGIGKGITELRFNVGPGYRIYCHQEGNMLLLLLAGGDKATQSRDIKRAQQLLKEWTLS